MQASFPFDSSINADKYYEIVPFVSTFVNAYIIFQKCVLIPLANVMVRGAEKNHYYTYLEEKCLLRCIILLVPIIGNIVVFLYDSTYPNNGKALAHAILAKEGAALQYASEELQNDRKTVLMAAKHDARALSYANETLLAKPEVILELLPTTFGEAMKYASHDLKNNKEFVLRAVQAGGCAIQYVSDELKKDREVCLAAVSGNDFAFWLLKSEWWLNDREIALAAISSSYGCAFRYVSDDLRNDKDFVREVLKISPIMSLRDASKDIRNDKEFILQLIQDKIYRFSLVEVGEELRDDKDFVLTIVEEYGSELRHVSERLKKDKEVVIKAIESYYGAAEYANPALQFDSEVQAVTANAYKKIYGPSYFESFFNLFS